MRLRKSLGMKFDFSKSSSSSDLRNKSDVQHKVLCDWLRNIHSQNIQIARKLTIITQLIQSSSPSGESTLEEFDQDDNLSDTESVR